MTCTERGAPVTFFVVLSAALAMPFWSPFAARPAAAQDIQEDQELAIQDAVRRIAPCIVRIEALGGLEKVGQVLVGQGPTTGLIVSSDGYIISSAFNFAQQPSSILVTLPSGQRTVAKLVAQDLARMLVLLKVNAEEPLLFPNAVPRDAMRVGQTAIAVGKTFDTAQTNVSVGIISALNRIWGKAIQTDAKISPTNYGGPLIDLQGSVLGVLVPLSNQSQSEVAGAELYDSGIGFAVPLTDIYRNLERLKTGSNLQPGLLGVSLKGTELFSEGVVIGACPAKSPAAKAGLKIGDRIVEVDGQTVTWQAHLKHALGPHYAGDSVKVVVERDGQRLPVEVVLTDAVEPYVHPFVGLLPGRDRDGAGVPIRFVYPASGAERAGLLPGDRIESLQGTATTSSAQIRELLAGYDPGGKVSLGVRRGAETRTVELTLGSLPADVPAQLPPARASLPQVAERPPSGVVPIRIPEDDHECVAIVPASVHPQGQYGVVVWLHPPGGFDDKQITERWQGHCEQADLIVLAPKSADPNRWLPTELPFVRKALDQLMRSYPIDAARIVVHGYQGGGALGYLFAFEHRDLARGIAAVDAPVPMRAAPPDNDPLLRLAIWTAYSTKSKLAGPIKQGADRLQAAKFPVTTIPLPEPRYLDDQELAGLVRWIDTLDRF
jgi:serine protease Do